ncbi:UDP-xylose and UDP-N-acetylglucosamine transporter-like [Centruroides vittatus]|uniref:UDP-xylose and UDP-N-acetylglucosamine transporter-like n=1 Tax=Centruroides vittatus TaxID=120091 RepID=UPI00350F7D9F
MTMIAVILVFIACCSNVIFLEHIIKEVPQSGNLITLSQFLFIAFEGLIFTIKFGTEKPVIPIKNYLTLVTMFLLVSVSGNYAHSFNIPMPLQMIFRSGSLIANMLMGFLILNKRYEMSKYISVIIITTGISLCTVASSRNRKVHSNSTTETEIWHWFLGLSLLTSSILLAATMGIYQEALSTKYGKHPKETLFYCHVLPLPGFILLSKDIYSNIMEFNNSVPLEIPILGAVPKLWIYLFCNVITQYVCIRSVFVLTTQYSSLSVTMVVTLRKYISLLISIFYFQNPFTLFHWIGTLLVFIGTMIFIDIKRAFKKLCKQFETKVD